MQFIQTMPILADVHIITKQLVIKEVEIVSTA